MTRDMRKSLLFLLAQWIRRISEGERIPWRRLGALIDSLDFLRAQIPRASLYLRRLNTELAPGVGLNGWNGWGIPSRKVISELRFWWRNVYYDTPHSFQQRIPRVLLMTDASEHG
jgi:hypothetical protein